MYLSNTQSVQMDGLGFGIKSITKAVKKVAKKTVQPIKHLQTKAPQVKALTAAAAAIPGPWQAITVPIAAGAQLIPAKKVAASATGYETGSSPVAPPPTGAAADNVSKMGKVILPVVGAGILAFLASR